MQDTTFNLWPGWNIDHVIGSGSYGKVYEIHRRNGDYLEKAALKVMRIPQDKADLVQLRMDGLRDENTEAYFARQVEQLRNEIGIMQRFVGNSNIVSYEDYRIDRHKSEISWDILIRMELLTPLPVYLSSHPMSEDDVIRLGKDICHALSLCHEAGIIHRDIKPQNIFVSKWGSFKLGDFGIARTMPGSGSVLSFKGTISYMAPETFKMLNTDARSDIYSLALVLYQILNGGREPFLASSEFTLQDKEEAQRRRISGEVIPPPEGGSRKLWDVLSIALREDPSFRYQTAEAFFHALGQVGVDCEEQSQFDKTKSMHLERGKKSFGLPTSDVWEEKQNRFNDSVKIDRYNYIDYADEVNDISQERKENSKKRNRKERRKKRLLIWFASAAAVLILISFTVVLTLFILDAQSGSTEEVDSDSEKNDNSNPMQSPEEEDLEEKENNETGKVNSVITTENNSEALVSGGINEVEDEIAQDNDNVVESTEPVYDFPSGTLSFGGHHYYIYDDLKTSWEDALVKCIDRGGYLAVINDKEENEALYEYMLDMGYEEAFFGLSYSHEKKDWVYKYGDSSSFRDWGFNSKGEPEPNHADLSENYGELDVHMSDGHWNDAQFGKKTYTPNGTPYKNIYTYICEWNS